MRLAKLSLSKYGHFEDCDLAFAPGAMDLHIVFGRNEAGKSTTLSAVGDLLFGFPHALGYNFRFHESLLRVGATIDTGDGTLTLRRRRGRKDTLLDASDAPVPEAALRAALHGLTRESFAQQFSLDHTRLRRGGREIVDAKDDVGAALFAAGAGVAGAQALLTELQAEADAIWGERRAGGRTYWQAARQFEEAEARSKAALVRPRAWLTERDRLAALEHTQAALEDERANAQRGLDRLQRIRRLAAPAASRDAVLSFIGRQAAPDFDPGHEAIHHQARAAIVAAELRRTAAEAALEEARRTRAAILPDRTLLEREAGITDLVRASGEAAKATLDLPAVLDEMRELEVEAVRLTREVGLRASPVEQVLDHLPPPALLADLQARADRAPAVRATLDGAREQVARDEAAYEEATRALALLPPAQDDRSATAALRHGHTVRAVADRIAERRRAVTLADRAREQALARLHPWQGTHAQLATMQPPGEDDASAAERLCADAERERSDAARSARETVERVGQLELEAAQITSAGRAVSAGDIGDARGRRDALWAGLQATLAAASLPDPEDMAAYSRAVVAADQLADRRFEFAEASARLANLLDQTALARLTLSQAKQRVETADAALAGHAGEWRARLFESGLPAMSPASCRQWTADRLDALRAEDAAGDARRTLAEDEAHVAGAHARLLAVCTPPLPPDTVFPELLERVQVLIDAGAEQGMRRRAGETAVQAAQAALTDARRRHGEREVQLATWSQEWRAAVDRSGLGLDADTLPALLPMFGQLRGALEAARRQQRRIAGIDRDALAFEAAVWTLAADCGMTDRTLEPHALVEKLRQGLNVALQDDRAAREADASIKRWQDQKDDAQHVIDAALAQLAPLLARAGLTDTALLAPAMEAWRQLRDAHTQLAALERSILADGDGYAIEALMAEVAGADLEQLGQAADAARRDIAALDARIAATAQEVGQARADFQALDHGEDAVLAAADERAARANMEAEAEAYLLKRTQAVMLRWAVEDYRKRQESPLLRRASDLFGTLTLGRYEKLDIDRSGDKPRLVGHCADGRSLVGLDGMSDGTADQLFLALRLAALEQLLEAGVVLPFLADDLFINFDDRRAHAGFAVLGEIAKRTQVLFFTHHDHLRDIATDALGNIREIELPPN